MSLRLEAMMVDTVHQDAVFAVIPFVSKMSRPEISQTQQVRDKWQVMNLQK